MAGYFGTELQQRLQEQAEASEGFIASTLGACQPGRMMGCDDPDEFGWGRIKEIIQRDGVFGFRLIDAEKVETIKAKLADMGSRFDSWNVYLADREAVLASSSGLARQLPAGYSVLATPKDPESEEMRALQSMMSSAGVAPFSGSMLSEAIGRAVTVVIGDSEGKVAASAHGYMPHNSHSPYHTYAWGGLVAVTEGHRAKGLGKAVNALMIDQVFKRLGASHIYELISPDNVPSRRMVEACGLGLTPKFICGIATSNASVRFTK